MQRFRQILSRYPVFFLTIPFTYLVHVANYYFLLLNWKLVIWEVLAYIVIPIAIYFIFARHKRLQQKIGILLYFFLVVFYFFHVLHDWLKQAPAIAALSAYTILIPALALTTLLIVYFLVKRKGSFHGIYYGGNLVFVLLLLGGIVEHIYLRFTTDGSQHDQADPLKQLATSYTPCDTCAKPDIYFIVLDGYTNSKTLRNEFNYENGWIDSFLLQKNFCLPQNSKSNYYFTQPSLASMLNMNYLRKLSTTKLFNTKEFFQSYYTVYHNELRDILQKQGYEINNFSIFDMKGHPSRVDPFLQELTPRSVTGQTFFKKLNRDIGYHFNKYFRQLILEDKIAKARNDIERIEQTYLGIIDMAKSAKQAPQFTYGHFLLPHETYYFDSTGRKNDIAYILKNGFPPNNYITQVAYTNRFIIAPIVDSIFAHAKRPFILLFMGDHGYRNYPPEKLDLEFENFSAIYFSNGQYGEMKDSLSSVNTFRIILNRFFHQQLPLLPDSSIYLKKRVMMSR
jgi:hypothetical protein